MAIYRDLYTHKHCIRSFPQHNHAGQLCLDKFFFTYRQSVFCSTRMHFHCLDADIWETARASLEWFSGGKRDNREMSWRDKAQTNILTSHTDTGLFGDLCLFLCWCFCLGVCLTSSCSNAPSLKRKVIAHLLVCFFVFVSYPSFSIAMCSIWGLNLQLLFSIIRQRLVTS